MNIPKTITYTVTDHTDLTHDVFEIEMKSTNGEAFEYKPGQFVTVKIPATGDLLPTARSYSILSADSVKGIIKLCVKVIPSGRGSNYLNKLKVGDEVTAIGPIGHFVLDHESGLEKIFVGTGTGIAPMRAMIDHWIAYHSDRPDKLTLYFGVRYAKDIFYAEYFEKLAHKYANFSFQICISRNESGEIDKWYDGRVSACLADFPHPSESEVYICGNGSVVESIASIAKDRGIDISRIHFEKFNNL